jgi:outer membrane lipoprotein SlyB
MDHIMEKRILTILIFIITALVTGCASSPVSNRVIYGGASANHPFKTTSGIVVSTKEVSTYLQRSASGGVSMISTTLGGGAVGATYGLIPQFNARDGVAGLAIGLTIGVVIGAASAISDQIARTATATQVSFTEEGSEKEESALYRKSDGIKAGDRIKIIRGSVSIHLEKVPT